MNHQGWMSMYEENSWQCLTTFAIIVTIILEYLLNFYSNSNNNNNNANLSI